MLHLLSLSRGRGLPLGSGGGTGEAALAPASRASTWEEALPDLRSRHADVIDSPAFRHGWERGQDYNRELGFGTGLKKSA